MKIILFVFMCYCVTFMVSDDINDPNEDVAEETNIAEELYKKLMDSLYQFTDTEQELPGDSRADTVKAFGFALSKFTKDGVPAEEVADILSGIQLANRDAESKSVWMKEHIEQAKMGYELVKRAHSEIHNYTMLELQKLASLGKIKDNSIRTMRDILRNQTRMSNNLQQLIATTQRNKESVEHQSLRLARMKTKKIKLELQNDHAEPARIEEVLTPIKALNKRLKFHIAVHKVEVALRGLDPLYVAIEAAQTLPENVLAFAKREQTAVVYMSKYIPGAYVDIPEFRKSHVRIETASAIHLLETSAEIEKTIAKGFADRIKFMTETNKLITSTITGIAEGRVEMFNKTFEKIALLERNIAELDQKMDDAHKQEMRAIHEHHVTTMNKLKTVEIDLFDMGSRILTNLADKSERLSKFYSVLTTKVMKKIQEKYIAINSKAGEHANITLTRLLDIRKEVTAQERNLSKSFNDMQNAYNQFREHVNLKHHYQSVDFLNYWAFWARQYMSNDGQQTLPMPNKLLYANRENNLKVDKCPGEDDRFIHWSFDNVYQEGTFGSFKFDVMPTNLYQAFRIKQMHFEKLALIYLINCAYNSSEKEREQIANMYFPPLYAHDYLQKAKTREQFDFARFWFKDMDKLFESIMESETLPDVKQALMRYSDEIVFVVETADELHKLDIEIPPLQQLTIPQVALSDQKQETAKVVAFCCSEFTHLCERLSIIDKYASATSMLEMGRKPEFCVETLHLLVKLKNGTAFLRIRQRANETLGNESVMTRVQNDKMRPCRVYVSLDGWRGTCVYKWIDLKLSWAIAARFFRKRNTEPVSPLNIDAKERWNWQIHISGSAMCWWTTKTSDLCQHEILEKKNWKKDRTADQNPNNMFYQINYRKPPLRDITSLKSPEDKRRVCVRICSMTQGCAHISTDTHNGCFLFKKLASNDTVLAYHKNWGTLPIQ